MKFYNYEIVFQEVPNEISLCFTITGCKLRCSGCHSSYLWNENNGSELTVDIFQSLITKYNGFISCILFMGGEWEPDSLILFLDIANTHGLKTCLYTGEDYILPEIRNHLTYLKTGKYIKELGGLGSPITNQRFIIASSGEDVSNVFNGV